MTNVETARRDITTAGCRPVGVWWGWERGERSVENVCVSLQCPCMFGTKGLLGPCFEGLPGPGVYKTRVSWATDLSPLLAHP